MFVLPIQTEIFNTGYCWIVHLSFLTSHNLLFFRFCKTSKKTTFSVFLSFFLVKFPKSQSLQLNISRTAWPILMILVSFCRILNGLSDESNLFWRCSSPLIKRKAKISFHTHFKPNRFKISKKNTAERLTKIFHWPDVIVWEPNTSFGRSLTSSCEKVIFAFEKIYITYAVRKFLSCSIIF